MTLAIPKTQMFVSKALRNFARGQSCQMMSDWCNGDPETVVLCHVRRRAGSGMAQKPHDFWAYHGCSGCHANEDKIEDRELLDAIRRTQYAVYAHLHTLTPYVDAIERRFGVRIEDRPK